MTKHVQAGIAGAALVTTTFLVLGFLKFGWQPESLLLALPLFVLFFGLFYRDSKTGEMMAPLWMGIFGFSAACLTLFEWTKDTPDGVGLVLDGAFFIAFVFIGLVGLRRWIGEEGRGNQRSGG